MPFVPVANTCLAEMRMTTDLQQVENTLYFEFGSAPDAAGMQALGEGLVGWWEAYIRPLVWAGVTLREVVITDLSSNTGPQVAVPPATPLTGELTASPLPTGVSLTISFRTALRGRSYRGRNYAVGLVEEMTTGANDIQPSVVALYVEAYTALFAIATTAGVDWVVVSRFSGVDGNGDPIPRAAGITTPVTAVVIVDNIVDSQRRRLPGRGK